MTHTPEPWEIRGNRLFVPDTYKSIATVEVQKIGYGVEDVEGKANASRIVACVNAMAGITDPQAFRDSVDKLTELTKEAAEMIRQREERIKELEARLDKLMNPLN